MKPADISAPVLILAPTGRDGPLAAEALQNEGIRAEPCASIAELVERIGEEVAAVLIAEEALVGSEVVTLTDRLQQQPRWSDLPMLVLTTSGRAEEPSVRLVNLFGPSGNVILLERPLRAVTLVNAVQVAVRSRQRQFQVRDLLRQREMVLASVTDAFSSLDREWRYIYVNDKVAELAGMPKGDLIGRKIWDVFPQIVGGEFYQRCLRAVETQRPDQFELFYQPWQRWLETRIYPTADGLTILRTDIHDRKVAEELVRDREAKLHETESFMRLLLNSVAEGFYSMDRNGVTTICNAAFLRMLGFEHESDVLGKKVHDLIHHSRADGSPYPAGECHINETAQTGKPAHVDDEVFFRVDGTSFPVEYWAFPIIADGELRGAVITFVDITERRQAEVALQRAKHEAEEANLAKDQFLAMLSHELRTPLTPVLMTIASLQRRATLSDDLRADLEVVQRNVELEARLIDDLLDLTRIRHGKLALQLDAADVHAAIEHALTISDFEIREKQLQVTVDLQAREHHCWADAARLQQVFWNLLKNAAKFTPAGGRLDISTRNNEKHEIIVRVSDSGIGIDAELMPRIFDAFEQGGHKTTARFGGLGLGLAISKRVIDLHQGTLYVESEGAGQGATFVVKLTAMATSLLDDATAVLPEPTAEAAPIQLLLVEDHEDTARVLQRMFRQSGYVVRRAANLAQAREAAAEQRPDFMISDLALPDGSGLALMRELRARYGLTGIALSGFGTEEDVAASMDAGFAEHLTKPVDWPRLRTAIARLASHIVLSAPETSPRN